MTIYFCRDLCCVCYYFLAERGRYICFPPYSFPLSSLCLYLYFFVFRFVFRFVFIFVFSFVFVLVFVFVFLTTRGWYICFRPILFSPLIIVKGFVELLIYPTTKTDESGCRTFFERTFSILYSWHRGRHKLIHEVVKRREQNMVRMGQLTMLQEGVMMGGKKMSNSMKQVSKS